MIKEIILIAFFTSLVSLIITRPFAIKFNLIDYPNERKNHNGNIPLIGGICIFLGVLVAYFVFIEFNKFISLLLFTSSLILIQGVCDDYINLKVKTKMAFQIFLTFIMIYITDVKLESFGHLFGVLHSIELGILSIPITIVAVVGLTNAINMIDGLDGFAASFVLIAIIGLFNFDLSSDISSFQKLLFAIAAALVPFMFFNIGHFPKMKVFLGDSGSLFLGFILTWSLIYSAENENNFNPSFALWCVAIPLFDFFSVIIIRIFEKRSLIIASKDHVHHMLHNLGFSKIKILLLTVTSGLGFLLTGKLIEDNFQALSFSIFIVLFLFYLLIRIYIHLNKKLKRYE